MSARSFPKKKAETAASSHISRQRPHFTSDHPTHPTMTTRSIATRKIPSAIRAQSFETALWTATTTTPGKGDDETAAIDGLLARCRTPAAEATCPAGRRLQQPSIHAHWPCDIMSECNAPLPAAARRGHRLVNAMHESAAGSQDDYLVERRMQTRVVRPTRQKLESTM